MPAPMKLTSQSAKSIARDLRAEARRKEAEAKRLRKLAKILEGSR